MQSQYLILAENITYKNSKLSCINILDQFLAVKLPSEMHFDLVAVCGPDWEEGEYNISIKVQIDENELHEFGNTKIKILNKNFVYNALAQNLKVIVQENTKFVKFYVYRDEELVIQRDYIVASMFVPQQTAS